ncbi:hydrogenase formation protein HypD [Streptomyces sp. NPDC003077]|uniref:hydrogenase formation protein HypD n=1 Tax=Streptomyces sp. NPDC003077 TaxID=3154443 RepID=UPI00339F71B0
MRYVDEYRDAGTARALAARIAELCAPGRSYTFMEVCGGHTHTIYKHGIEDLLPENVTLVHGPGCPVCVIPMGRVDDAIHLAGQPGVIMTAFGDMMRVPGGRASFLDAKAAGADVRMVYSPLDALRVARENPDRRVVFMAIGFETTAPSTAVTLLRAEAEGLANFSVFCNHVTIIPAVKAILDSPDLRLDGFIGPGHVSTVIGCEPYRFIAEEYGKPLVVAGFEPLDILQSLYLLLRQLAEGRTEVENQYGRAVPWNGNEKALRALSRVMTPRPHFEWRGLGFIAHSALRLREEYAAYDAERVFDLPGVRVADPKSCQCGEVLKGVLKPWQCKVFGTACTPETPIGTCMVSSEGACAAYYNFGRFSRAAVRKASGGAGAGSEGPGGHRTGGAGPVPITLTAGVPRQQEEAGRA